jgi:hypothetical protein
VRRWLAQSSDQLLKSLDILKTPVGDSTALTFEDREYFEEPSRDLISRAQETEERAALVQYGAGVPREWAEGFARLDRASPPRGFSPGRWQQVIDDGGLFLDRWASKAAALGWDDASVFGVDSKAPGWRLDHAGLVVLIDGADVTAITDRTAILRLRTGSVQVYHRQDATGAVPLWLLL